MFEVLSQQKILSLKILIKDFDQLDIDSTLHVYENDELLVTPVKINKLFSSYGKNFFSKQNYYVIDIALQNPKKFFIVNSSSNRSIYENLYKTSVLIRPFFLKNIFLDTLKLKDYQIEGMAWLKKSNSRLLADDMGLGKTLQTIAAAASLISNGEIKSVLVVCPTSLVYNWCFEIQKWLPAFSVTQISNTGPGKLQNDVWNILFNSAHFIVTSYDHIRSLPEVLSKESIDLLVVDEAHKLRKSSSKIHKSIKSMDVKNLWALTGTPIEKNTLDLINILTLIDKKLNKLTLQNFHDGFLSSFADEYILRRMKSDVLSDLKGYQEINHVLELTKEQMQSYKLLEAEFCKSDNSNRLKLFGQLKQICDFDARTKSSSKINYSLELIEKIISNNEKCVIFSFSISPLIELKNLLDNLYDSDFSIVFDGSLDKGEREKALVKFKQNINCPVLLCSGKIGGEGINLTEANHVIFINNWWNPSNNSQARDRVVRIGQGRECFIHNMRAINTIESRLDEILDEKELITDTVIETLVRDIEMDRKVATA